MLTKTNLPANVCPMLHSSVKFRHFSPGGMLHSLTRLVEPVRAYIASLWNAGLPKLKQKNFVCAPYAYVVTLI